MHRTDSLLNLAGLRLLMSSSGVYRMNGSHSLHGHLMHRRRLCGLHGLCSLRRLWFLRNLFHRTDLAHHVPHLSVFSSSEFMLPCRSHHTDLIDRVRDLVNPGRREVRRKFCDFFSDTVQLLSLLEHSQVRLR